MTSGKSDLVNITCSIKHETDKAYLIESAEAGDGKPVWIAKSQCEDNGDGTFSMPEWIATEKGLI